MRPPLFLIVAATFGCVVLGVATLSNHAVVLSIPLLAYLFGAILEHPETIRLSVLREISPDYAPQGVPITVKLTLTNQGEALDEVAIRDILPEGVRHLDGQMARITCLEPGDAVELTYTVDAHRGFYDTYEVQVYVRDFMGFFEQPVLYRTSPRLVVHPRYPKLSRIKIRPPQTRGFAGPITARQGGTGIDFWSVREYQSGDSQRQINWRLTARSTNELYTNIFEQERVADVGLILDARLRVYGAATTHSLFESAVHATAAFAEHFLSDGNRVSLLIYGSEMRRVFPGYGRVHQNRILTALSKANPGVNYALASLAYLPTRLFPARSQIVIVSPLVPEDIPFIVRLRARGYAVMVISPDPISYEAGIYQDSGTPAYRLAFAEREFMLRQIRRSAVQVVNWQADRPLEVVVTQALAQQRTALHINRIGV